MICERCTYGRGSHICTLNPRVRERRRQQAKESWQTRVLAKYADNLVTIAQELRDTANLIDTIESEPALIGALMDSGDWRMDEIDDLHRHVADLRARIGVRA
jgi:hypothetical protein